MDFAYLKTKLNKAIMRQDYEDELGDYINKARRELYDENDWTLMKKTAKLTWAGTSSSLSLPADFKHLTDPISPLSYNTGNPNQPMMAQIPIKPKKELERLESYVGNFYRPNYVNDNQYCTNAAYLDWNANVPTLNFLLPQQIDLNVSLDYYGYYPDLVTDTDTCPLCEKFPDLVIWRAKTDIFEEISDPQYEDAFIQYNKKMEKATAADGMQKSAGVIIRF